jgi:formylmethanofuran dehydrogenase subunit E
MPSATSDDTSGHRDGVSRPHWYVPAWLEDPGLPSFEVIDTRSAQGRLDPRPKTVTVADLVLFHGHACDGLLRGIWAMRALADVAFPGQPFDRSDLVVVSKNSPCLGDLAAYLTGGRARFGTHRLDDTLGVGFEVQRLSTGEAWEVREEPGFFPPLIAAWEAALLGDHLDPADKAELLAVHESAQWDWVRRALLLSAPAEHYNVARLDELELPPALLEARRTDTVNRAIRAPHEVTSRYEPDLGGDTPSEPLPRRWAQRYQEGPTSLAPSGPPSPRP